MLNTNSIDANLDDDQMLTTTDNPWSPFDNFDEWYAYDVAHGYNTCAYISRVTGNLDPELDDYTNDYILTKALNEIISMNLTGNYILVTRDSFTNSKNDS